MTTFVFWVFAFLKPFGFVGCFWIVWINGSMGWSKEVEGGEVIASAISAATRWRGWEDDKTDVSW